ncbi:MAG TPA: nucleotidyltransferase family protein [Bryobacteraceae bacterium]
MNLAAIILSGGASTRMGSPKALLRAPGGGETFLDRLIGVLGAHASPVIVVLGHEAERIRAGSARAPGALFVTNARYREGQLSSLQCGLAAVPRETVGFLFTPVDIPLVRSGTVEALAMAFEREAGRALVAVPRCEGRRGHPVCCARELIPEFLALPPEGQARDVIHRHASRTCYVDVDDPGVLRDIDDFASYCSLPGLAGSQ